jgi:sulfotransferase family protein
MEHWRTVLSPGVMIEVHYEELVADLEDQARAIVDHCRLEWDDSCLAFHQTQRPVKTASAVQVREPVYRTSIGRWRRYENFLQPLIQALSLGAPDDTGVFRAASSTQVRQGLRPNDDPHGGSERCGDRHVEMNPRTDREDPSVSVGRGGY